MRTFTVLSLLLAVIFLPGIAVSQTSGETSSGYAVADTASETATYQPEAGGLEPSPNALEQPAHTFAAQALPSGDYPSPDGAPAVGPYGPGVVYVPYEPVCPVWPRWSIKVEVPVLQRSTTRSQPIFLDGDRRPIFDSRTDLDFPVGAGIDFGVSCHFASGWELQFGLFGIDWVAEDRLWGHNFLVFDNSGLLAPFDDATVRYRSAISTFEVNFRRPVTENIALLAGFRLGSLDERYTAREHSTGDNLSLSSATTNSLFGFQIGADGKLLSRGAFCLSGLCKAGIYGNAIEQKSRIADRYLGLTMETSDGNLAFLGETGLVATYQFSPRLSARAFYQVAWLEGVALAPDQIAGTNFLAGTATIDSTGGIFYHGGGLGLEWKF